MAHTSQKCLIFDGFHESTRQIGQLTGGRRASLSLRPLTCDDMRSQVRSLGTKLHAAASGGDNMSCHSTERKPIQVMWCRNLQSRLRELIRRELRDLSRHRGKPGRDSVLLWRGQFLLASFVRWTLARFNKKTAKVLDPDVWFTLDFYKLYRHSKLQHPR